MGGREENAVLLSVIRVTVLWWAPLLVANWVVYAKADATEREACGFLATYVFVNGILLAIMAAGFIWLSFVFTSGKALTNVQNSFDALGMIASGLMILPAIGQLILACVGAGYMGSSDDGTHCHDAGPMLYNMALAQIILVFVVFAAPVVCWGCCTLLGNTRDPITAIEKYCCCCCCSDENATLNAVNEYYARENRARDAAAAANAAANANANANAGGDVGGAAGGIARFRG